MTHKLIKIFVCSFLYAASCFASYSIDELSLEEKVGQLLMVHFNGEDINDEAKELIQDIHVGGFCYYNWANGLHSPQQVLNLSTHLQQLSQENIHPIPLLISTDQEGGRVARLTEGFTIFPGNWALGETGCPALAEESAFVIGQELSAVAINMNLAPVVDINNNPRNPIIGTRSFGDSADLVVLFSRAALQGYKKAKIITTLKHFPGHGDVEVDSHEGLPVLNKTKRELEGLEFIPFATLASQADAVMTAYIMVPSIDPENCATLSKKILDILRDEMNFEGVIISDSLVMEGLLKNATSIDEAAIRALAAGCDILLLGGKQLVGKRSSFELTVSDVKRIHQNLVKAVKSGRISEERVNQAVERILNLKNKYLNPLIFIPKGIQKNN